jgi:hypothetical protein
VNKNVISRRRKVDNRKSLGVVAQVKELLIAYVHEPRYLRKLSKNEWIDNWNWVNYDLVHAITSTESLPREATRAELYKCYESFFWFLE